MFAFYAEVLGEIAGLIALVVDVLVGRPRVRERWLIFRSTFQETRCRRKLFFICSSGVVVADLSSRQEWCLGVGVVVIMFVSQRTKI